METEPHHEQLESDVSQLLLQPGKRGLSMLYEALSYPSSAADVPEGNLKIDLDLTGIEDKKILEMVTYEIKLLLEDNNKAGRFTSVHIKIKRSQMNNQIINYRAAFPSKYEVVEDK